MEIETDIFGSKKDDYYIVRERAERLFEDSLAEIKKEWPNNHTISVINYFGIGGIGKTSLLNHLENEARVNKDLMVVHHDFAIITDMEATFSALARQLETHYGFSFPLFDAARFAFSRRNGGDIEKKEKKAILEAFPAISLAFDSVENIVPLDAVPAIKTAMWVFKAIDKGVALIRDHHDEYKREFEQIDFMSDDEIKKRLPGYFAFDLRKNMSKANGPLVVLFDTYEHLMSSDQMTLSGDLAYGDEWLRNRFSPIRKVPGVLWVIAGREAINWEEDSSDWSKSIRMLALEDFSKTDSEKYLAEKGIKSAMLRRDLFDFTNGTPDTLRACAERFAELAAIGKDDLSLDDFKDCKKGQAFRYLRGRDAVQREVMYTMAEFGVFTREQIIEAGSKISGVFSIDEFELLSDSSFVNLADGKYVMNRTVRDALRAKCPKEIHERAAALLVDDYRAILQDLPINDPYFEHYFTEFLSVIGGEKKKEDVVFCCKKLLRLIDARYYGTFVRLYRRLRDHIEENKSSRVLFDAWLNYFNGRISDARVGAEKLLFGNYSDNTLINGVIPILQRVYEIEPSCKGALKAIEIIERTRPDNEFALRISFMIAADIVNDESVLALCKEKILDKKSSYEDICIAFDYCVEFNVGYCVGLCKTLDEKIKTAESSGVDPIILAKLYSHAILLHNDLFSDEYVYEYADKLYRLVKNSVYGEMSRLKTYAIKYLWVYFDDSKNQADLDKIMSELDLDYAQEYIDYAYLKIKMGENEKVDKEIMERVTSGDFSARETYDLILLLDNMESKFCHDLFGYLYDVQLKETTELNVRLKFSALMKIGVFVRKLKWIEEEIDKIISFVNSHNIDNAARVFFAHGVANLYVSINKPNASKHQLSYINLYKGVYDGQDFEVAKRDYGSYINLYNIDENEEANKLLDDAYHLVGEKYPDSILGKRIRLEKASIGSDDEFRNSFDIIEGVNDEYLRLSLISDYANNMALRKCADPELVSKMLSVISDKMYKEYAETSVLGQFYCYLAHCYRDIDDKDAAIKYADKAFNILKCYKYSNAFEMCCELLLNLYEGKDQISIARKILRSTKNFAGAAKLRTKIRFALANTECDLGEYADARNDCRMWVSDYSGSSEFSCEDRLTLYRLYARASRGLAEPMADSDVDDYEKLILEALLSENGMDNVALVFSEYLCLYERGIDILGKLVNDSRYSKAEHEHALKLIEGIKKKMNDPAIVLNNICLYAEKRYFPIDINAAIRRLEPIAKKNLEKETTDINRYNDSLLKFVMTFNSTILDNPKLAKKHRLGAIHSVKLSKACMACVSNLADIKDKDLKQQYVTHVCELLSCVMNEQTVNKIRRSLLDFIA